MKIASPELDKIIIELTPDDMRELDINYDKMDYACVETRQVFRSLLEQAQAELGRKIDTGGRMMIETVPEVSGGCLVCFTILEEPTPEPPDEGRDVLSADFSSLDALLGAAKCCAAMKIPCPETELFTLGTAYRLKAQNADKGSAFANLISEFADNTTFGNKADTAAEEHWQRLGGAEAFGGFLKAYSVTVK